MVRNDICVYNSDIEACFIQLDNIHTTSVIVGIIYNPPPPPPPDGSYIKFITHFTQILARVNNDNKKCYLHMMGDFNINLLNYNSDRTVTIYLLMYLLPNLLSTINKPS